MPLIINTNLPSLNAQRNISKTNFENGKTLERLSSGLRINRAGDDAAGLAISEKLRSQVRGLNQAIRNSNDGISLVQTAEGALNTVTNIVQRLRELAVQSASDTNTTEDRNALIQEADQLIAEITRIGNTTEFNGKTLLNGTFSSGKLHIGANYDQSLSFTIGDVRATALGRRATVTGDLDDGASATVVVDAAITGGEVTVNGSRIVTTTADDQTSVLELVGSTIVAGGSITSGQLEINSVVIGDVESQATASAKALAIASAINAKTSLAGKVSARVYSGTAVVLTALNGTDLSLKASGATAASLATITGITASFFGSQTYTTAHNGQSSALAKAAAVHAVRSVSNVSAYAQTTTVTASSTVSAIGVANGDLYINGVNIGAVTVTASDGTGALVSAINSKTSDTGVSAYIDTTGRLVLNADDGRNITVTAAAATLTATGLTNTVTRGKIDLVSTDTITLAGTNVAELGDDSTGAALTATTFQPDLNNVISTVDLATQSGANSAILSLDAALAQLNSQRAEIGALQNRLESAVDSLSTSSENLSASESRIRDADFAAETARFTRNQILIQAGTSILAQANTLPQLALRLLQ